MIHFPEYNAPILGTRIRAMVDKVGGGKHGQEYTGNWIVTLIDTEGGKTLRDREALVIPDGAPPLTHSQAAEIAFIFLDMHDDGTSTGRDYRTENGS